MERKTPIYLKKKAEPPNQSDHKGSGRPLLSHLWLVLASHKSLQPTSLRKPRWWPPQNTNPVMELAENETILLSKLRLGYDIWHEIWSFPQKNPYGRGSWLCSQSLWGQELWEVSKAESSPGAREHPLWLCSAASPLLQVLWSCNAQNKRDQWIIKQKNYN